MWWPPRGKFVATIVLYAKDPDAAVEFYVKALNGQDLGCSRNLNERLVKVNDLLLAFRPKDYQKYGWTGGLRGTNGDPQSKPLAVYVRLDVEDVLAAYYACLNHGARPTSDKPNAFRLIMSAAVRTPDGHLLEFVGPVPEAHPEWVRVKAESQEKAKLWRLLNDKGLPGESFFKD